MRESRFRLILLTFCILSSPHTAADTPAAKVAAPPDSPVPLSAAHAAAAPADESANDAACRIATRDSAGAASCISSSDADHDGVSDGQDQCPDTTPGVAVDATGCARAPSDDSRAAAGPAPEQ